MKSARFLFLIFFISGNILSAQGPSGADHIDRLLIKGDYEKVIDTCALILAADSLNASVYYKAGLAWQNLLSDEKALNSFAKAVDIDPGNANYTFALGKAYYNKGKYKLAEPLFQKLSVADPAKWAYAFYLTSVYMQTDRYDEALIIYDRFLKGDSLNSSLVDKAGFAYLRKGDYPTSIEFYNRSLLINPENVSALKNLSFLYASTGDRDTATQLLTQAIKIDPTDMDLYNRRGQIYFSQNYTSRGLNDYLMLLKHGDSSAINLKRAGIGYCNNMQPARALPFLLRSYQKDSSDYETCSYLGQTFYNLKDMSRSIYYYKRTLKVLSPIYQQTGLTYVLLAESQKGAEKYEEALASYLKAQEFKVDPNIYLIIANLYDEQLGNKANAIKYYQLFLNTFTKLSKTTFTLEYVDSVKKRLEFLKEEQKKQAAK